jgi:transposase
MNGIFYVLRTGCQWKAAPAEFGSGSSLHRYFQEYARRGVLHKLWKYLLRRYDELRGIQWQWQNLDGSMTKAPLGGEKNREKPYGSREAGGEAVGADRCPRSSVGRGHRWRQCP